MSFTALGLAPSISHAASTLGLMAPTAVQSQAVAAILNGQDVRACAPTGSGKTAAYILPLLQLWMLGTHHATGPRPTQALVLVPTRELATQVAQLVYTLGQATGQRPKVAVLTGGVSINPQLMALRGGVDWVIATPGRLLDVAAHSPLNLRTIQTLVMDEADRLMDLGFAQELDAVLALLPPKTARQTLLLSATFAPAVQALVGRLLRDAHHSVQVDDTHQQDATIVQRAVLIDAARRTAWLTHWAQQHPQQRMLVFVASRYSAEHVTFKLRAQGIEARAFHGELSQGARQQALTDIQDGPLHVLVTTDLAARGIHIQGLPMVINYDLPRSSSDYTHRIGRTGRAGLSGCAISLVSPATQAHWQLIAKRNDLQVELETWAAYPVTEQAPARQPHEDGHNGGIKGKRMSKKDKLRAAAAAQSGTK